MKLLFLQMAIVLIASRLLGSAFRLIRQPEVLGEMTAGILLGPSLLGQIAPDWMNGLFPSSSMEPLYGLSQLGLVLFVFLVGLQLRLGLIRKTARSVVLASQASIVAPFVCGAILALGLYPYLGGGAPKLPFVLFFGTAMGITAFPVLARILADRNLTNTRVGTIAISCAAVDDLSAWCLLAVITVLVRPGQSHIGLPLRFVALVVYVLVMVFVLRPALQRWLPSSEPPRTGVFAMVIILLLAYVWTTEALGIHALFGAFLPASLCRGPSCLRRGSASASIQ